MRIITWIYTLQAIRIRHSAYHVDVLCTLLASVKRRSSIVDAMRCSARRRDSRALRRAVAVVIKTTRPICDYF